MRAPMKRKGLELAAVQAEISRIEAKLKKLKATEQRLIGAIIKPCQEINEAFVIDGRPVLLNVRHIDRQTLDQRKAKACLLKHGLKVPMQDSSYWTVRAEIRRN